MGSGMAGRLLSANFPVSVYNRNRDKAAPFAGAGATVAGSPREAASRADIIISMVADDVASRGVWLGENGALAGVSRGVSADRMQHAHGRLDQGTRGDRGGARMRVAGRARDRHQASRGLWRVVFPDWRFGGGACHRPARPLGVGPRIRSSRPDRKRCADEAHQQFHVRRASCVARGSGIYDRRRRARPGEGARDPYPWSSGQRPGAESRSPRLRQRLYPELSAAPDGQRPRVRHRRGFPPRTQPADRRLSARHIQRRDRQRLRRPRFFRGDQVTAAKSTDSSSDALLPRDTDEGNPLPGQSKLQLRYALRDRHPRGRTEQLQLAGVLQSFVLRFSR